MVVHLQLDFPETYPTEPPTVHLLTGIPHDNVINSRWNSESYPGMRPNYLCLDMLRGHDFFLGQGDCAPQTSSHLLNECLLLPTALLPFLLL